MSTCPSCLTPVRVIRAGVEYDHNDHPIPPTIYAECPTCHRGFSDRDPLPRPHAFPTPPPAAQLAFPGMPPDTRRFDEP